MGGMIINTYLDQNPEIAERVAGVIYSAPFFGIPEHLGMDPIRMQVIKFLSLHLEEFALSAGLSIHTNCRNKAYMRTAIQGMKAVPFISLGLMTSFFEALKSIESGASKVKYPY